MKWEYTRFTSRVGDDVLLNSFSLYTPYGVFQSEEMKDLVLQVAGRGANSDEAGIDLFLNALGDEGWELIHVWQGTIAETGWFEMEMYFKRPKT